MQSNNTTRRYPRTMEEAFGPGHRGNIWEPHTPMSLGDKVVMAASLLALGAVFLIVLFVPEAGK